MNKEKTNRVLEYFDELFPDAYCELNHESDFQLLVAVMLSAQTTDKKVNQLTENLFKKYPTVEAVSQASLPELEQDIKTIGLYRNKAKNLLALSHVLIEQFDGIVPSDQKQLESLPGVGRKTANVVRSVAFDIPAFAVDTHVERISKRLGFAKRDDNVLTVEKKLCRSYQEIDGINPIINLFSLEDTFVKQLTLVVQNVNCLICVRIRLKINTYRRLRMSF